MRENVSDRGQRGSGGWFTNGKLGFQVRCLMFIIYLFPRDITFDKLCTGVEITRNIALPRIGPKRTVNDSFASNVGCLRSYQLFIHNTESTVYAVVAFIGYWGPDLYALKDNDIRLKNYVFVPRKRSNTRQITESRCFIKFYVCNKNEKFNHFLLLVSNILKQYFLIQLKHTSKRVFRFRIPMY